MTEHPFSSSLRVKPCLRTPGLSRGWIRLILGALLPVLLLQQSSAGLLGPSLPKGKEIDDRYIAELFAPEFPYESIKVIETPQGKRYVIIKAKKSIDDDTQEKYRFRTLASRNIVDYGSGSEHTETLLVSELTMYRFPSEKPYVVEYCQVEGQPLSDKPWAPVEDVLRFDGKYIVILVNKDFGRVFKRVVLYPEEDAGCPEPPFVGKYPNSKNLACFKENDRITFVYATPDDKKAVFDYYKPLLRTHYDSVGFCYPETRWGLYAVYGMILRSIRFADLAELLEHRGGNSLVSTTIPAQKMVFEIRVDNIIAAKAMKEHSLLRIRVGIDPQAISETVNAMKRYCREGAR